jgi:hypothetical protein
LPNIKLEEISTQTFHTLYAQGKLQSQAILRVIQVKVENGSDALHAV